MPLSAGWYVHEHGDGPTTFDHPAVWESFPSHYRSHNPWCSNFRIILRNGALLIVYPTGQGEPLAPLPDGWFRG